MRLPRRRDSVLCLLLALGACDDMTAMAPPPPAAVERHPLRLQIGDKLRIVVIGDDKLTGEYQIDERGRVSVPAAGPLAAAGLTSDELAAALRQRLRERQYLLEPIVNVTVAEFRPFYVLGEVEKPGEYPYHAGLNILSAIAVAGGETYRANTASALVQRAGEPEFRETPLSPAVPIYPGDLIKVRERLF
jgi:polysaccharide export outer membrane protein